MEERGLGGAGVQRELSIGPTYFVPRHFARTGVLQRHVLQVVAYGMTAAAVWLLSITGSSVQFR